MSNENKLLDIIKMVGTIGLIAVVVVFFCLGRVTLEHGVILAIAIAVPSGAPELIGKARDALAKKPPSAHVLLALLVALSVSACALFRSDAAGAPAPSHVSPCHDDKGNALTIEQCAGKYQAELLVCTTASHSRAESEACEDDVRARYGQPPRIPPSRYADAGAVVDELDEDLRELVPASVPPGLIVHTRGAS